MQETQRAKTAYAEYLAMGPGRSLEKLLAEYQERKRTGKGASVPTTRYATLADWSRKHGWQARVAAFEGKQNEALVARSMDDIEKARQDSLRLVQAAKVRVAQAIKDGSFKADDASSLERVVKLEMQLHGSPLAEKLEHSGPGGGPLEVAVGTVSMDELMADDEGRALLSRIATRLCPRNGDAAHAGDEAD